MTIAKLVASIEVKEVQVINLNDGIECHKLTGGADYSVVHGTSEAVINERVETAIVPIHKLRGSGKDNSVLVAYSPDVQELLEMPFDAMKNQIAEAESRNNRLSSSLSHSNERIDAVNTANPWTRIKYVFGLHTF